MEIIEINTSKKYKVHIGSGTVAYAGSIIADAAGMNPSDTKVMVVTDETVNSIYGAPDGPLFSRLYEAGYTVGKFCFPGGEQNKTVETVNQIVEHLAEMHFSRQDMILAFGGGIVGDVAGFAASIYKRGIRFIQMPTTLLADVDSSVGGKTGVNLKAGKNLAGSFWQPEAVIIDTDFLKTLPDERFLDGLAEIIKAGVIADKTILDDVNRDSFRFDNSSMLNSLIVRALTVKREIVEADEHENGDRVLLNFGHTVGHAIEKCSNYRISHGIAVAIGMYIISLAAEEAGWTSENCSGLLYRILSKFSYPLAVDYSPAQLAEFAMNDKKAHGSEITLVYPNRPGNCVYRAVSSRDLELLIRTGVAGLPVR